MRPEVCLSLALVTAVAASVPTGYYQQYWWTAAQRPGPYWEGGGPPAPDRSPETERLWRPDHEPRGGQTRHRHLTHGQAAALGGYLSSRRLADTDGPRYDSQGRQSGERGLEGRYATHGRQRQSDDSGEDRWNQDRTQDSREHTWNQGRTQDNREDTQNQDISQDSREDTQNEDISQDSREDTQNQDRTQDSREEAGADGAGQNSASVEQHTSTGRGPYGSYGEQTRYGGGQLGPERRGTADTRDDLRARQAPWWSDRLVSARQDRRWDAPRDYPPAARYFGRRGNPGDDQSGEDRRPGGRWAARDEDSDERRHYWLG